MTSPPTEIEIECPACHTTFKTWHRASINLAMDNFSDKYIEEVTTAKCPGCKRRIALDCLVVDTSGVWTSGPARRTRKDGQKST